MIALGTSFLVANGLFLDNGTTRLLAHRFWYPCARVSYGIYLTHPYVLFWLLGFRQPLPAPDAAEPGALRRSFMPASYWAVGRWLH